MGIRFTLLNLLGAVVVASVGAAALANPSAVWLSMIHSLVLLAVLAAAFSARFRPFPANAFAQGFLLTAAIYGVIAYVPWLSSLSRTLPPAYLTNQLAKKMHGKDAEQPTAQLALWNTATSWNVNSFGSSLPQPNGGNISWVTSSPLQVWTTGNALWTAGNGRSERFFQIAQALWTLLFGLGGGCLGASMAARAVSQGPAVLGEVRS